MTGSLYLAQIVIAGVAGVARRQFMRLQVGQI